MMTKYLGRFLLPFAALLAANSARADEVLPVVPLGNNSYSITVKASHKFTRDTQKLKDQAIKAATEFCAKEGKQLKVVSVKEDKSLFLVGDFTQTTLNFRALSPGDPDLVVAPEEHPKAPAPINADILTSELTKLDALRKQGLLTDEEFTAAKKKLLDRL